MINFNKIEDFVLPDEIEIHINRCKENDILRWILEILLLMKKLMQIIIPHKYEEAIMDY